MCTFSKCYSEHGFVFSATTNTTIAGWNSCGTCESPVYLGRISAFVDVAQVLTNGLTLVHSVRIFFRWLWIWICEYVTISYSPACFSSRKIDLGEISGFQSHEVGELWLLKPEKKLHMSKGANDVKGCTPPQKKQTWQWQIHHEWRCISYWKW